MRWVVVAAGCAAVAAGCFGPDLPPVACGAGDECPPGLACNTASRECVDPADLTGDSDAMTAIDAAPAIDAGCGDFAATHFDACAIMAPGGSLDVTTSGSWLLDTDNGTLQAPDSSPVSVTSQVIAQTGGPDARLLSVSSLTIASTASLVAVGDTPLVFAVWGDVAIDGNLSLSSRVGVAGAGHDPGVCASNGAQPGATGATDNGGGGGGGGFAGPGGNGGTGDVGSDPVSGGKGGVPVSIPTVVRGGCPGASGGGPGSPAPGSGGGAVQITALTSIVVTGNIAAGGGAGNGGANEDGGGGGGSGGYVGLEAPAITLAATSALTANGGGGGGGGCDTNVGARGQDAGASNTAAQGGVGGDGPAGDRGGDGGTGSAGLILGGGVGESETDGAGGGGGAAGYVLLFGSSLSRNGTESPRADAP